MTTSDWRIIVLLIGAFDIFFAIFLLGSVAFNVIKVTTYRRKRHIFSIGTSYILLAVALWLNIAGRAISHAPTSWRLPIASVAFPLGVYALWQLVAHNSRKGGTP